MRDPVLTLASGIRRAEQVPTTHAILVILQGLSLESLSRGSTSSILCVRRDHLQHAILSTAGAGAALRGPHLFLCSSDSRSGRPALN